MRHQKHVAYRFEPPMKNLSKKKCFNIKNKQFEKKDPRFENTIFTFMTTFHNFAIKIESGWAKRWLRSFWILETPMMYICKYVYMGYFPEIKVLIWSLKNQLFFNFNCSLLIRKLAEGLEILLSWNWGIPIRFTFFRKKFVMVSWCKLIISHGEMKCVLLIIFLALNLTP